MKEGALRRENVASVPPVCSPIALDSVRPWLLVPPFTVPRWLYPFGVCILTTCPSVSGCSG